MESRSHDGVAARMPARVSASVSAVSGLHYYLPTQSLLVLSDTSREVLETTGHRVTDRLYLSRDWSGLTDDISGAAGIAMDDRDNLYIVSEPDLFYQFAKTKS